VYNNHVRDGRRLRYSINRQYSVINVKESTNLY
jgi:hypothetical protein